MAAGVLSVGKLFIPSGFTAEPDGAIYVSNCSIARAPAWALSRQEVRIG